MTKFKFNRINSIENKSNAVFTDQYINQGNDSDYHENTSKNGVSFAFAVFLNFILTIICLSVTVLCLAYVLQRYLRRREMRDKLCGIVSSRYWLEENKLMQGVQMLTKMREVYLFIDVTAYSIVCYKYRTGQYKHDSPLNYSNNKRFNKFSGHFTDVYEVLRHIERYFDTLSLQLLCQGKCPDVVNRIVGPTLFHLARETFLAWSDLKSPLINKMVGYFSGSSCSEVFRSSLISDSGLSSMVTSRIPYVSSLILSEGCLVMKDTEVVFGSKLDLWGKIRFIDVVLARKDLKFSPLTVQKGKNKAEGEKVSEEKLIGEAFYAAKEICSKQHLISENLLKQLDTKGSTLSNLRHMLRVMACNSEHVRKLQNDDSFFHFIIKLYEGFYSNQCTKEETLIAMEMDSAILEVMDRTRNCILRHLDEIIEAGPRLSEDKHNTRVKLEQIEQDLKLHLNYLSLKHIVKSPYKASGPRAGKTPSRSPVKVGVLGGGESEVSVYTMAQSSSCLLKPQKMPILRHFNSNPECIDKTSTLSSRSSMYATATSIPSPVSPPPFHKHPIKSVTLPPSDSEEGFETPV